MQLRFGSAPRHSKKLAAFGLIAAFVVGWSAYRHLRAPGVVRCLVVLQTDLLDTLAHAPVGLAQEREGASSVRWSRTRADGATKSVALEGDGSVDLIVPPVSLPMGRTLGQRFEVQLPRGALDEAHARCQFALALVAPVAWPVDLTGLDAAYPEPYHDRWMLWARYPEWTSDKKLHVAYVGSDLALRGAVAYLTGDTDDACVASEPTLFDYAKFGAHVVGLVDGFVYGVAPLTPALVLLADESLELQRHGLTFSVDLGRYRSDDESDVHVLTIPHRVDDHTAVEARWVGRDERFAHVELRGVLPAGVTIVRLGERSGASRAERDRSLPVPPAESLDAFDPVAIVPPGRFELESVTSRFDPAEELSTPAVRSGAPVLVQIGDWTFPSPDIVRAGSEYALEDFMTRVGYPNVVLEDSSYEKEQVEITRISRAALFSRSVSPEVFDGTVRVWSAMFQFQKRIQWSLPGESRASAGEDRPRSSEYGPPVVRRVRTVELIEGAAVRASNCDGPPPEED